eukprot:1786849-Rhodomonas_salina.1
MASPTSKLFQSSGTRGYPGTTTTSSSSSTSTRLLPRFAPEKGIGGSKMSEKRIKSIMTEESKSSVVQVHIS